MATEYCLVLHLSWFILVLGFFISIYYISINVKLKNNILLNLSEINIEESLNNYIKLIKKFNNSDIIAIKSIDLRDSEKTIISFK